MPDGFCFSVKVPKRITHVRRLVNVDDALDAFIEETAALGSRHTEACIRDDSRPGWIRGDSGPDQSTLSKLVHPEEEKRALEDQLADCEPLSHASPLQT